MKKSIYFIAIIPDEVICEEVKAFKRYAEEHFDSARALRSPAHITLEPPFKWDSNQLDLLQNSLNSFAQSQTPFDIQLQDFDTFSPKVIFVDVVENPVLNDFQQELKDHLRNDLDLISDRPDRKYHPHVTIAFKDLRKAMFPKAWDYFSKMEYQRAFTVNQICLLKHNGEIWEAHQIFHF